MGHLTPLLPTPTPTPTVAPTATPLTIVLPWPPTSVPLSTAALVVFACVVGAGTWWVYRQTRWAGRRWFQFAGGALFSGAAAVFATTLAVVALSVKDYVAIALFIFAFLLALGGIIGTLQAAKAEDVLNIETVTYAISGELLELLRSMREQFPDDENTRSSFIREDYDDRFRVRIVNVTRAFMRHGLSDVDKLLRFAESTNGDEMAITRIYNSLNRRARELREKNLE